MLHCMAQGSKTEQLVVRIAAADREWLDQLARDEDRSLGAIVRRLIAEARERQLEEVAA